MTEDHFRYKHFGNGTLESTHGCFKKFGQELDLEDQAALDMLQAGGGILTVEQFLTVNFTPEEKSNRHTRSGPAYMERHNLALKKRLELIEVLKNRIAHRNEPEPVIAETEEETIDV